MGEYTSTPTVFPEVQTTVPIVNQKDDSVQKAFDDIIKQQSAVPSGLQSVIFKLKNPPNGKVHLDGIDDVFDPETKGMRRMRLLRGVPMLWQDQQEKIDKDYINKNRISITFIQGGIILDPVRDATIISFCRKSNCFAGNQHRIPGKKREFYEWSPAEQERVAFEKDMLEQEVWELAMEQPIEKVRKHGLFLGISFNDEMGMPRTEKGIRTLYNREARRDPKRFKDTLDSKEVEISFLIKKAIIDAKIDISGKHGSIHWANGPLICKLPHGRQASEYLVDFAMLPTDEAKDFLERLQKGII